MFPGWRLIASGSVVPPLSLSGEHRASLTVEGGAQVTPRQHPAHSPVPPPLQVSQVCGRVSGKIQEMVSEGSGTWELEHVNIRIEGQSVLVTGAAVHYRHHTMLQWDPQLLSVVVIAQGVLKGQVKKVRGCQPPETMVIHVVLTAL